MNNMRDRFVSIFLLLVCGVWIGYSGRVQGATMPGAPGPLFFPFIIVGILAFLVILNEALFFRRWLSERKKETVAAAKAPRPEGTPNQKKVILSFALIFLYVVGIDHIGFYVSTLITVFVIFKLIFAMQSWIKTLFSALGITGVIYLIFTFSFGLFLPRGILF